MIEHADGVTRCFGGSDDILMQRYHDEEWGVEVHDERMLFELLSLEGFQAGLSWRTVLHKREALRTAFEGFDPYRVSMYTKIDRDRLLADAGIIRHRLKIMATIGNAQRFLGIQEEWGSFDQYIWQFTGHEILRVPRVSIDAVPAFTPESDKMSADLNKRGFRFVGTKICYAFMQATGMVDDHIVNCFRAINILY